MALTDEELLKRLRQQQWTSHNICLSSGVTTMPGTPDFLETDLRLKAVARVLSLVFREELAGLRIADLGCLEGGFSLALAQRGARVLGIEARAANLAKAMLLREHFGLSTLNFVLGDVKDFSADRYGVFDATLALGIAYHLDWPVDWLRQVGAATSRVLIVDSHYAPDDDATLRLLDPRISMLGPLENFTSAGVTYRGRWFFEYGENVDREPQLWASYSNCRSVWLTKESLLRAMLDAGFPLVFEQHDYIAPDYKRLTTSFPRTMLVGIKL